MSHCSHSSKKNSDQKVALLSLELNLLQTSLVQELFTALQVSVKMISKQSLAKGSSIQLRHLFPSIKMESSLILSRTTKEFTLRMLTNRSSKISKLLEDSIPKLPRSTLIHSVGEVKLLLFIEAKNAGL